MILTASKLITLRNDALIINGAIVSHRGTIVAVGPASTLISKYPGHRLCRFDVAMLMPGLVNLHTHLELPSLLDAIRADTFPGWVLNLIKKKKELAAGDYCLAAKQNIKTLVRTGTTTVGEICTHQISPALLKQSGLRAVIYRELISLNPAMYSPRLSSLVSRPSPLTRYGISPHAPHTVSEKLLRELKKKKFPLSTHVAESKDEIRLLQGKRSGFEELYRLAGWDLAWAPKATSPFEYLKQLGLLGPGLLTVHAVQATDKDIHLLERSHTPVAHCPRSNKELGVGRMPLKKFLDAGVTVGLGTDSLASAPSLSMWDEMRYALRIHRRDGVTAGDLLRLATSGGAKALGMGSEIGTLEPGKRADLIAVPLPGKNTGDIYSDLLRETKSCIMTMVDGKLLYSEKGKNETV
jgi:cytosine/adenosine deaminase-related metal-dependent hydrolase